MSTPDEFTLTVKNIIGRYKKYPVKKNTTIRDLKQHICDGEGILPDQIRIVCKGRQLKDPDTMEKLKLKPGSKLSMVLSLRGGLL